MYSLNNSYNSVWVNEIEGVMTHHSSTGRALSITSTVRRWVAWVVVALLLAVASSAAVNTALTSAERARPAPYGQRVVVGAGSLNVYRSAGSGPALVLLSGLATPAPAVDFAPLIRELDGFDVIVVEGFGYGGSDLDVPDRSVENITAELHEALQQVGVRGPVILAGHSIGGVYARYYARAYPGEVSALIGIDPTVAKVSTLEVGQASPVDGLLAGTGLVRWAMTVMPDLALPASTAYTESEREQLLTMARRNFGNRSLADEEAHLAANLTRAAARPFPSEIPVLEFLAGDTVASSPDSPARHESELAGVRHHEIRVIPGAHYLHWTQATQLGRSIADFVARAVPTDRTTR